MSKDGRTHGRRRRKGEREKSRARRKVRHEAWAVTGDGAGPRDISDPGRHHRR